MARLAMAYVKTENGMKLFAPLDAEDESLIGDNTIIISDTVSNKAARTDLQRRAQHLYFTMLADALNDAGLGMKEVLEKLSKNAMIPWSQLAVKERLWKPVQKSTYGKESTTKLNTGEVSPVYEALNLVTSEVLGISIPFPDKYSQMYEQLGRK